MKRNNKFRKIRQDDGFTLIDLSIILIVAALLLVPIAKRVQIEYQDRKFGVSSANESESQLALMQFFDLNNRFPCPADPTLGPSDKKYGEEVCSGASDPIVGGLPFKQLKLPIETTLDGYGNKITYAVSRNVTNPATFSAGGTIKLVDTLDDGTPQPPTTGNIFVLISHGPDGLGAYTAEGNLVADCTTAPPSNQTENCDGDDTFNMHLNRQAYTNDANYFDDFLRAQRNLSDLDPWQISDTDPDDIYSPRSVKIGIGTDKPKAELDVAGNIRAREGNAEAGVYCISDPDNPAEPDDCFSPTLIGGTGDRCSDSAMTGISYGGLDCDVRVTKIIGKCSGTNRYIIGIKPNGEVVCGTL